MNLTNWITGWWSAPKSKRKPAHVRRLERQHEDELLAAKRDFESRISELESKLIESEKHKEDLELVVLDLQTQNRANDAEITVLNTQIDSLAKVIARDQKRVEAETQIAAQKIGQSRAEMEMGG